MYTQYLKATPLPPAPVVVITSNQGDLQVQGARASWGSWGNFWDSWVHFGGSWDHFWGSWGLSGGSWGQLGSSSGHAGGAWDHLRRSWDVLGRLWGDPRAKTPKNLRFL